MNLKIILVCDGNINFNYISKSIDMRCDFLLYIFITLLCNLMQITTPDDSISIETDDLLVSDFHTFIGRNIYFGYMSICEASLQNHTNVVVINYNNLLILKCDCSTYIHLQSYFLYENNYL